MFSCVCQKGLVDESFPSDTSIWRSTYDDRTKKLNDCFDSIDGGHFQILDRIPARVVELQKICRRQEIISASRTVG